MLISPGTLDFGDVSLGQSSVKTIVLSNTEGTTVAVSQISFSSSAFLIVNAESFPISIPAGGSHSISVGFKPTAATDYSAEIVVADSAAKPMAQVATHGRGRNSTQLTAQMSVSTSRLDFGSVTVGSSTTQALTLSSAGTAPVTVNSAMISGTGFSLVGRSLPATLNPNQSLTLQVQFSPTATGATSGQLTISSDSATNNTTTVLLRGSGAVTQLPQLTLSVGSLSFGSVTVNTSTTQTLTLTSTGTATVTVSAAMISGTGFSLAGGRLPATLNPNQSLTLQIQFSPTATGMAGGQLTLSSNSATGSTAMVALSGTSISAPSSQLTVSAGSLSLGSITVNTSTAQSLTLTSTGTAPVTVNSAVVTGAGFAVLGGSLPVTLNPTQSVTLQVQFSPTTIGPVSGQLTIRSNSSTGSTTVVSLNGTSTAAPKPQLTVSSHSLNFGNVTVNTAAARALTLTSTGTSPVTANSVAISGTGFTILAQSFPMTLNPTQSVTLQVQFSPTSMGSTGGQVTINSNSTSGSTSVVTLIGTGTAANPQLTISAGSLDFGSIAVNTSTTKTLTLTSTGTSPLMVESAFVSGMGFALVGGSFPIALNPTQSLTLQLWFLPTTEGMQSGQITINSNSTSGSTSVVALSGTGTGVSHEVDLSWDAPTSSPVPVAGYNVYRSVGSSGSFRSIRSINSSPVTAAVYLDSAVVSGTTYLYVVKSVDATGKESSSSNQIMITIPQL